MPSQALPLPKLGVFRVYSSKFGSHALFSVPDPPVESVMTVIILLSQWWQGFNSHMT